MEDLDFFFILLAFFIAVWVGFYWVGLRLMAKWTDAPKDPIDVVELAETFE